SSLNSDFEIIIDDSDTYTLLIQGNNGVDPVDYNFTIITPEESTTLLTLGNNNNPHAIYSELTEKGEIDYYTFNGEIGQRLLWDRLFVEDDSSSHTINILAPSGKSVLTRTGSSTSDPLPFTLSENGIYTIKVDGDGEYTGTYSFSLLDLELGSNIELDTAYNGTLEPGQQTHIYQFSATSGQQLFFDTQGGDGTRNTDWTVYDSGNNQIKSSSLNSDFEIIIDESDTYTLLIQGDNGVNPVNYNFTITTLEGEDTSELINEPETVTPQQITNEYTIGETITTRLNEAGEKHTYTFAGNIGQQLWFDSLFNSSTSIKANLLAPTGKQLWDGNANSDQNTFVLTEEGNYTLNIDGINEVTGDYSFRLLDLINATTVNLDTIISGNFGESKRETRLYQFSGNEGQSLYLDRQDGSILNQFQLYDSYGKQVFSQRLNTDQELVLPQTGVYTLAFVGTEQTNNNYQVELVTPQQITNEYTIGETITTRLNEAGEKHTYTFEGNIGQQLWFDSLFDSERNIQASLLAPSGKQFWNKNLNSNQNTFVLTEEGTYTLIVDGTGDITGDYAFRLLDIVNATPVDLDTIISGNFGESKRETHLYQFSGNKGQTLYLDSQDGSSGNQFQLYDLYGKQVFSQRLNTDQELVLPQTGV
ncbi:MAG: hypothetical protein MK105_19750, partial [Crocinitomicaceae bacterium]|nr:hypothetical protein [Crocinitomicaceae bacterium]